MYQFKEDQELKITVATEPKIIIPRASFDRIMQYVTVCDLEISGFMEVERDEVLNTFTVGRIYLLKQEVSGADTEMDDEAIAKFMDQMMEDGRDQMPRGWWHSHVNMDAFWSGTDWGTIKDDLKNESFFLSIVFNKRQEMRACLRIHSPIFPIYFDDLAVEVEPAVFTIPAGIKAEVERKVKKHVWEFQKPGFLTKKEKKKQKKWKKQHPGQPYPSYSEYNFDRPAYQPTAYSLPEQDESKYAGTSGWTRMYWAGEWKVDIKMWFMRQYDEYYDALGKVLYTGGEIAEKFPEFTKRGAYYDQDDSLVGTDGRPLLDN